MRGVASYVMRGRLQALLVVMMGASTLMFAWISAAVIALVTMRRGLNEGAFLLIWALLPAGYMLAQFGDSGPLAMLVGTTVLAVVLRWTVSLPLTLMASVAVGGITGYLLLMFGSGYLEELAAMFAKLFENLQANLPEGQRLPEPGVSTLAGMLGLMNTITCVLCLLLARWWQASLYNPGGFREEFHAIRLTPQLSVVLAVLMLAVSMLGVEYRPWAMLFAVPLSIAGLGFLHARAAHRKLGMGWLSMFYLLWLVLDPIKLVVIGIAIADSFADFRKRWQSGSKDSQSQDEET
mgnify:CR=1 FL=1|jgi:hypothetical protein